MTKTPLKISDTGRAILTLAATREDRMVRPPTLSAAARLQTPGHLDAALAEDWSPYPSGRA